MPEPRPRAGRTAGPVAVLVALTTLVAGCGQITSSVFENVGERSEPPSAAATSEPAAASSEPGFQTFSVPLVQSNFTDECADPIAVDELFCVQVDILGMTADGTTLIVPTTVNATGMEERSAVICDQIAIAHFDGATGEPLGFETILVLDRDGDLEATCTIHE